MKTPHLRIILLAGLLTTVSLAYAQDKNYSNVYIEKKVDGTWSGTTKTTFTATLGKHDKGDRTPIYLSLKKANADVYYFYAEYEAQTPEKKAFHKFFGGVGSKPFWESPTGSTDIDWVYFNKDVYDIWAGDPKPFHVEIEFADGSAVKYYISP